MNGNARSNEAKSNGGPQQEGITEITVGGFKSIATTQSIEVRPLTILAGANSSGKSSFLQPLLLLKQTLDAPYDPGSLLLDGPNVKFTSGDQFISRVGKTHTVDAFHVAVRAGSDSMVATDFTWTADKGIEILNMECWSSQFKTPIKLRPNMTYSEIETALPADFRQFATSFELPKTLGMASVEDMEWVVGRERCFLTLELLSKQDRSLPVFSTPPASVPAQHLQQLIHVPGLRGGLERTYPKTGGGPGFPGTFDNYVASVVNRWQVEGDEQRLARLNAQLKSVGLAREIQARRINDAQIELHVDRLPATSESSAEFVNIADVAFGVPTVLPVLVALIAAQPGQSVYIEQPEIHLHPRAQVKLADVLADAAKRGGTVIAETHSSLLIRAIQTLVAKGDVDPKLVMLHWFSRDQETGESRIASAELDENGAFGDWPTDFDEVELQSEGEYLDAVELRSG